MNLYPRSGNWAWVLTSGLTLGANDELGLLQEFGRALVFPERELLVDEDFKHGGSSCLG